MPASPSSSKFRAPPSPASVTSSSDLAPHQHFLKQDAKHIASEVKRRVSRLFRSKHHHHHTHSNASSGVVKVLADGIYHTLSDPILTSSHSHGVVHALDSTPTKRDVMLPESPSGYSDSGDSTLSSISGDLAQTGPSTERTDSSPPQYPHSLLEEPDVDRMQVGTAPALPKIVIVEDESTIERPASWTSAVEEEDPHVGRIISDADQSPGAPTDRATPSTGDDMWQQGFVRTRHLSLASIQSLTAPLETLVLMDGEVRRSLTLLESLESLPETLDTLALLGEGKTIASSKESESISHATDVPANAPLSPFATDSPVLPSWDLRSHPEPDTPRISSDVLRDSALLLETDDGSELLPESPEHTITQRRTSDGELDIPDLALGRLAPTSDEHKSVPQSGPAGLPAPAPLTSPRGSPESTPYAQRRPSLPCTPRMPGLYRWPTPGPSASVGDIETDRDDDAHSVYLPALDLLRMFVPIPNIRFRFVLKFLLMWWLF